MILEFAHSDPTQNLGVRGGGTLLAPYRVCFVWSDDGTKNVEIVDYH